MVFYCIYYACHDDASCWLPVKHAEISKENQMFSLACCSPCTQQPLNDRQQEVPATERRFQKPLFVQQLILGIASQVEDEIDHLRARENSPSSLEPPFCRQSLGRGHDRAYSSGNSRMSNTWRKCHE